MSTRSFIGRIDADNRFKGRYVHNDGYPGAMGPVLVKLVEMANGSLEHVLKVLTEDHYGWSFLRAGYVPKPHLLDARGENVEGYGLAYTTAEDQATPEDWVTGTIGKPEGPEDDTWGTEWGYVFTGTDVATAELVVIVRVGVPKEVKRIPVKLFAAADSINWLELEGTGDAMD